MFYRFFTEFEQQPRDITCTWSNNKGTTQRGCFLPPNKTPHTSRAGRFVFLLREKLECGVGGARTRATMLLGHTGNNEDVELVFDT
jgi:hypothetical protein